MRFENVYFINGSAYAGKSTMVRMLAEKYDSIECGENYHDCLADTLDSREFPGLTYTRDLKDWGDFVRRTPEEYEAWIKTTSLECEKLELQILEERAGHGKKVFVDTNISLATLREISDKDHVLIMLADPGISVSRFFDRPDSEKQFLYQLLLKEPDPQAAIANFRECLSRINSVENYNAFKDSGFNVLTRDDSRTPEETLEIVEKLFRLV